ncbi:hypothetical protein B0H10DRAFT_1939779 [Mycena sp. CBHHK59/15]|nr:hypothetical protein B0H10DRAFT_1939779 [Mycena sp. CBHHK59/15]
METVPSPKEDFGDVEDIEFRFEIVGEEVGYNGEIKHEVCWAPWKRESDGTDTTWESADTLPDQAITAWNNDRRAALPGAPDIVLWGTTDIANTRTRERQQGHDEALATDPDFTDFDTMIKGMDALMNEKRELFPDDFKEYAAPRVPLPRRRRTHANAEAGPSRDRVIADAGPSRTSPRPPLPKPRSSVTHAEAEAGPSRDRANAEAGHSRASSSRPPLPKLTSPVPGPRRPPAPSPAPIPSPPRRASPAVSVSSAESIQFVAYKPATRSDPAPMPPPASTSRLPLLHTYGTKRKAAETEPDTPPAKRRPLALPNKSPDSGSFMAAARRSLPKTSAARPYDASRASTSSISRPSPAQPAPPPLLPRSLRTESTCAPPTRPPKRSAPESDSSVRVCACGTLLPPPDANRRDVCDVCRQRGYMDRWKAKEKAKPDSGARSVPAPSTKLAMATRTPTSPLPLPGSARKGKEREHKSLRLQTETAWSSRAEATDGAAGISFVNEVDDEPLPPTLSGDGWEFRYLEDEYEPCETLLFDSKSMTPLTPSFCFTYCNCESEAECRDSTECDCQRASIQAGYAYTDHSADPPSHQGLFNFTYDRTQEVVECNPYCKCSPYCPNRVAQRPRTVSIEVFKTLRCGWGVRAPVDVVRGTVLGMYTGKLITRGEAEQLTGDSKAYCFDLDYNEDPDERPDDALSVDSLKCGNWTRFINHSCEPNLCVQPVVHDTIPEVRLSLPPPRPVNSTLQQNMALLAFIAMQAIPAYTEFTFDYNPQSQREHDEAEVAAAAGPQTKRARREAVKGKGRPPRPPGSTDCLCGAAKCRGWVRLG